LASFRPGHDRAGRPQPSGQTLPHDFRVFRALQFAATAGGVRGARYRDQAAQLRRIVEAAATPQIRDKLLDLADQIERLAETIAVLSARNRS
jgi:hypothetical protein